MSVDDRQISRMTRISMMHISPLMATRKAANVGLGNVKEELEIQHEETILTSWRESRC
jgi:hypothetical protein